MSDSIDLFTLAIRKYDEGGMWGKRKLGLARYALDFGRISLILEFWWLRSEWCIAEEE